VVNSSKVNPSLNVNFNIKPNELSSKTCSDIANKITNVAPHSGIQTLDTNYGSKIRNDRQTSTEPRKLSSRDQNQLGVPRSRRPIVKGDYGRVSDLSFLTNTDSDAEPNDTVSDYNDTDDEQLLHKLTGQTNVIVWIHWW